MTPVIRRVGLSGGWLRLLGGNSSVSRDLHREGRLRCSSFYNCNLVGFRWQPAPSAYMSKTYYQSLASPAFLVYERLIMFQTVERPLGDVLCLDASLFLAYQSAFFRELQRILTLQDFSQYIVSKLLMSSLFPLFFLINS
jgi:hypothetical protein